MTRPTAFLVLGWTLIVLVALGLLGWFGVWVLIPRDSADALLVAVGFERGTPERHLVPEGYDGWLTVRYGVEGAPPLETSDGALVHRYPDSGVLETSTAWTSGVKKKVYFRVGDGEPAPQLPNLLPGFPIEASSDEGG
jgi:hypothetical protein